MTKENRFEGLMGVVGKKKNTQTSKNLDVQESKSRKKNASKSDNESSKSLNVEVFEQSDIQTSTTISADESDQDIQETEKLDVQTSKSLKAQTSKKAKSVDPDYTRTTLYLPKKMHKQLKTIALEQETEMSSIVEELIEGWLNSASSAR